MSSCELYNPYSLYINITTNLELLALIVKVALLAEFAVLFE